MAQNNLHRLISQAKTSEPLDSSFLADLNHAIVKIDQENGRKPSKSYKPSSLSCLRNMYYQRIGQTADPKTQTADFIGLCQTGSDRHEHIQQAVARMKDFGIDCEYLDVSQYVIDNNLDYLTIVKKQGMETKLWHKHLNMSFLCDGIIRYKGELFVLEIKTEAVNKWYGRKGVADEHRAQGTAYSLSFDIHQVMFVYENRDMSGKKAFILPIDEDMTMVVVSKIEECEGYVNRMIAPPKDKDLPRKVCNYCNYKSSCRKDGK